MNTKLVPYSNTSMNKADAYILSREDAYILSRAVACHPVGEFNPSPLLKPWLYLLRIDYKQAMCMIEDTGLLEQIIHIDPSQDYHSYINEYRATFPLMTLEQLESTPLPTYAVERYPIYGTGFNILYGTPGVGKSLIAVDFMGWWGQKNDGLVLYVSAEGRESFGGRFKAWKSHYRQELPHIRVWSETVSLADEGLMARLVEGIQQNNIRFVVFDTLADCMLGADENSTRDMSLVVHQLERLRRATGCGVLIIHHTNKLGAMRGSKALEGKADSIIKATLADSDDAVVLHNTLDKGGKNRHRKEADPLYLRRLTISVDYYGQVEKLPVLELSDRVVTNPALNGLSSRQKHILEYLQTSDEGMTVKVLMAATQNKESTTYHNLMRLKQAGYVIHDSQKDNYRITEAGKAACEALVT